MGKGNIEEFGGGKSEALVRPSGVSHFTVLLPKLTDIGIPPGLKI